VPRIPIRSEMVTTIIPAISPPFTFEPFPLVKLLEAGEVGEEVWVDVRRVEEDEDRDGREVECKEAVGATAKVPNV